MTKRYPRSILVSCEVPWDERQELIEDTFRAEIRDALKTYNNLYIFGTAGEGYAVTLSQFKEIVGIFREETNKPDVHPMVGIISMSTALVVEKIAAAHDIGFRVFQIAIPPWGALTDDEYMTYFKDVCGSFPDARFIHYNLPRSRRLLFTEDYKRLEAAVPNLVGTKYTKADPEECRKLVTQTELQHLLGEDNYPFGSLHGECSILASWGARFPSTLKELFALGASGEFEKAYRVSLEIGEAASTFLAPARAGEQRIDGAFDKMIVRASGIDMPLRMLSPYNGFDLQTFEACLAALKSEHPHMLG